MSRKSFVFYRSFYEAIKNLPRDVQGEIYTAIMEYSLNGMETENLKPVARSIFTLIKPQIEANRQRYENGQQGGRPKKEVKTTEEPTLNQTQTTHEPNVNVNDNANVNVLKEKESKKKTAVFNPPTLADVEQYCKRRNNTIDAQRFVNFYEAKGWMVGKNKMKNWQAAVRSWENLQSAKNENTKPNVAQAVNQTKYEQF